MNSLDIVFYMKFNIIDFSKKAPKLQNVDNDPC